MIEGLRILPWLHEALRRNHPIDHLADCSKCKTMNNRQARQAIGCGWEPRVPGASPWTPANLDATWRFLPKQPDPKTCPGFTTALPEVLEIANARVFAKEFGGLREFCDEPVTTGLRMGVLVLEGASNEAANWSMANPKAGS